MKKFATDRTQDKIQGGSLPVVSLRRREKIEKLDLAVDDLQAQAGLLKQKHDIKTFLAKASASGTKPLLLENSLASDVTDVRQYLVNPKFRLWTIIVAAFGDVVEPRGGAISLGNLTEIFGVLGVDSGVLRTVLARLASDGCLVRHRRGRRSFYELTEWALGQSREVAQRVYRLAAPLWNGSWHLIVPLDAFSRPDEEAVQSLRQLGFGVLKKGIFVAPLTEANIRAEEESGGLGFVATLKDPDQARELVSAAWDLKHLAELYKAFILKWSPLERDLDQLAILSDIEALALRVLLIYELRRAVLQDPGLPEVLLDHEWPGAEARKIAARVWRALTKPSERWLSKYGEAIDGPLPPANAELMRRFLF